MNSFINLDYSSRIPIYQQILNEIERYVALEILKSGEQIPSIRELAGTLGINPNTVKKSYDILENNKIIRTMSTKGTFICDNTSDVKKRKIESGISNIKKQIEELTKLGINYDEVIERLK